MTYVWLIAILTGAIAGVATPAAWYGIDKLRTDFLSANMEPIVQAFTLPAIAGTAIFFMFFLSRAFRSADGFTYFIADLHYNDGNRSTKHSIIHGIAAFFMLLGGGAVGMEAVNCEILSAMGAKISAKLKLPPLKQKTLMACGFAASLAAMFGQPAPAFLFVIELLYGWGGVASSVGPLAVAAFLAAGLSKSLTSATGYFHSLAGNDGGLSLAFRGANFEMQPIEALSLMAVIGIAAGIFAPMAIWLFRRTDYDLHSMFNTRRSVDFSLTEFAVRVVAWIGLTTLVFYVFSDAAGTGIDLVYTSLGEGFLIKAAVLAIIVRVLLSVLAYSVLGSIGLILPVLVIGALLGSLLFNLTGQFFEVSSATFALLAMGAFFSASFGTPVSATALVFGYAGGVVSGNIGFLVAALAANFGAHLLCGLFQEERMGTMGLYRHGIRFRNGMCFNTLSSITVQDAMITWVNPVKQDSSIGEAYKNLMNSRFLKLPVVDGEQKLKGIVSLSDFYRLEAWKGLEKDSQVYNLLGVEEFIRPTNLKVRPEMSLEEAIKIMGDEEVVPVADDESGVFKGLLLKTDLVNLYNKEVVKKSFRRETF